LFETILINQLSTKREQIVHNKMEQIHIFEFWWDSIYFIFLKRSMFESTIFVKEIASSEMF